MGDSKIMAGGVGSTPEEETAPAQKRPYTRPMLEDYGDLRDLTLGGSPTAPGDSIGTFNTRPQ